MSYRKKHIKSKIHNIRPKKSIFRNLYFWLALLIIIFISSLIYFLFFYSYFQVKEVLVSGNQKISSADLKDFTFNNSTVRIINDGFIHLNSQSIFLINSAELNYKILDKFSGIKKVKLIKIFPETLKIDVTERQSVGIFCRDPECFSIDESGIIFENQDSVLENNLIVRQMFGLANIQMGQQVVAKDTMSIIFEIEKTLKDKYKIDIREAIIASSVRLNIKTSDGWQVYFNLGNNAEVDSQLTKLSALLGGGISENSRKNLHYIDLRPKDRAIVCDNATCGG